MNQRSSTPLMLTITTASPTRLRSRTPRTAFTYRNPNVKIPFFKGGANLDPGEYREWRREIAAIKHSYKIEDKDVAGLVFLAAKGDARDVLWNIDPSDFTDNANA